MKIRNGKIAEATEDELYRHWLKSGWDDIMDFNEYKLKCIEHGTLVLPDVARLKSEDN